MGQKKSHVRAWLVLGLGWLIPGLGHVLHRRYVKGAVFFGGIGTLLLLGVLMQGKFWTAGSGSPLEWVGLLAGVGNGALYFLIRLLGLGSGQVTAVTFDYGTAYLAAAGCLNYLVALNAFDMARGRGLKGGHSHV